MQKSCEAVLALLVAVLLLAGVIVAGAQAGDPVEQAIIDAALRIQEVGRQGGNVSAAVDELNRAIRLWQSGQDEAALESVDRALMLLPEPPSRITKLLMMVFEIVLLATLPLLVYLLLPRMWAKAWAWARRDWIVEEERP